MPLHIVLDARRIRDFGIGAYIRSMVHALGRVDTTNDYTIISGPAEIRTLAGLPENFRMAEYGRRDISKFDHFAFPWFLRRLSPSLVHIPLNRVPVLMPKPYVVTIHDMASLLFGPPPSTLRMQARRYIFRRGLTRANRVIAVSEATKRDVEHMMGVPSDRIRRVYNAADPGFLTPPDPRRSDAQLRILERYQINYPYLLYAGNIRRHKNVPRLVEAFAVVREQLASHPVYRDLRLVIIGDTISLYPDVRATVIKSRVEPVVRFLGFVPFEALRCFYEFAAAFVFPSRYEGFGLPPLEAMACGAPVVVSNVSSLPEVVGDAAVQVNPENVFEIARGIRQVLLDEELRADLIQRGKLQAARFSWDTAAREVLAIYREAVESQ
jgi:glycosyltransferase involved in cell wall biosynthesis